MFISNTTVSSRKAISFSLFVIQPYLLGRQYLSHYFIVHYLQGTEVVPPNSRSHTCLLSGVYIGGVKVLVRLSFGLDGAKDVAMKLAVRSDDVTVSDAIHEIVASG
jgi:hypothetical protein